MNPINNYKPKNSRVSNNFKQRLMIKKFTVSVEIAPSKDADLTQNFREVSLFAPFVDVVNVTDSSMARMRPASFVVASLIQRKFDIDAIFNYTCRDRNVIGLKSDLLGALALNAVNVLALTGDPPIKGDHPKAKPVYEVNSEGLLKITKELSPEFFPGAVINFMKNLNVVRKNVMRKKEAGAEYFISQPVYTKGRIDFLQDLQTELNIPIIVGILPIRSWEAAKYMQEQVPGITIPEADYKIFQYISDDEIFARQIKRAQEIVQYARDKKMAGVHFMPLGRGDKIPEILGYNHEQAIQSFFKKSLKNTS
jgi:5,10-methylenetetrahydrofolate reductase